MLAHFSAEQKSVKESELARQTRRIDWIEMAGEIGAQLKEVALIKQLQPTQNRPLRKKDEVCTWTLIDQGDGWLRPQLCSAHELIFSVQTASYGLFKTSKEATDVLRTLAAEYKLCDALLGLDQATPGQPCPCLLYTSRCV